MCCAGGLANLCEVEDTLDQGIIPCLIALAAAEEFDTLVRVASAFEYLSGVGRARTLMAKQPTMPHGAFGTGVSAVVAAAAAAPPPSLKPGPHP